MIAIHSSIPRSIGNKLKSAFTLVELLVVIAIISILAVIVSTSFSNILSSSYDSQLSQIANTFVRARAYAMANNTYVFVGIEEVAASFPASTAQQTADSKGGAIAIAVIAMNDGSRGYDPTNATAQVLPATTGTTALTVSPAQRFDNIHILPGLINLMTTSMPTGLSNSNTTNLGVTPGSSSLSFTWPLGSAAGAAKYQFSQVIQFNPQGEGQVVTGTNPDGLLQWIEMDVEPSHGSVFPTTAPSPNNASILIDGVSGAVRTFRT